MQWRMKIQMELTPAVVIDRNVDTIFARWWWVSSSKRIMDGGVCGCCGPAGLGRRESAI